MAKPVGSGLGGVNFVRGRMGEAVSARQVVYLDQYNEQGNGTDCWYRTDNNSVSPVRVGREIGITLEAIGADTYADVAVSGVVGGYSGLDPGLPMFLSATEGGLTRIETQDSVGGFCRRIVGYAISPTEIMLTPGTVSEFVRQNSNTVPLAPGGTVVVNHYQDLNRHRRPFAYQRFTETPNRYYLLRHYRFEAGSGSIAYDYGYQAVNGSLQGGGGAPTFDPTNKPTLQSANNSAMTFPGNTTGFVSASDAGLPTGNSARTVAFWARPTSLTGARPAFGYGTYSSTNYITIYVEGSLGGRWRVANLTNATSVATADTNATVNVWQHVAVTVTPTPGSTTLATIRLYLNGRLVANLPDVTTTTTLGGSSGLTIGKDGGAGFQGQLDEVRVYDYDLSNREIVNLAAGYQEDGSTLYAVAGAWAELPVGSLQAGGDAERIGVFASTASTTFVNLFRRPLNVVCGVRL